MICEPRLSVVVLSRSSYSAVSALMLRLQAQTIAAELEILFAVPERTAFGADMRALEAFHSWKIIEVGPIESTSRARSLAIPYACAPLVAFTEEHCFPEPRWAASLVAAHDDGCAVAGPVVSNANPTFGISWAQFFLEYGMWAAPHAGGEAEIVAGNNSCYRRDLLLALGDSLEEWLDAETLLHWEFRRRGLTLRIVPGAEAFHVNITRRVPFLLTALHAGRRFAKRRSERWPLRRRALFCLGSPLLPLIRLPRIARDIRRAGHQRHIPRSLPWLVAGLFASAVGEMQGYAGVLGRSREYLAMIELDRERFLRAGDRIDVPASQRQHASA